MDTLKFPDNAKLPGTSVKWGKIRELAAKRIREAVNKLPDKVRIASKKLAEKGWFLSVDLPIRVYHDLAISVNNVTESNLIVYYQAKTDQILADLETAFPERSHLFHSAFEAHKQKNYNASIPLFLAQSEGVCVDMLGEKLYSKRNGAPRTKSVIENRIKNAPSGGIIEAFVEPLLSGSALSLGTTEMEHKRKQHSDYNVLNRHEIMHGSDKNYGSEINSLRAISLLDYLIGLKKHFLNP